MKDLLVTNVESFIKVSIIFADAYFMKEGVLFCNGEKWKRQRKCLKTDFTFDKLT